MSKISLRDVFNKKMLIFLCLGFSSGLPLLLIGGTLKTWLAREQVDISTIGYFSWVGMAFSLKFLWAPFLDRFELTGMGRRRSWMLLAQAGLFVGLLSLGFMDPKVNLPLMAALSVVIAFFSATQDIAIDAYRREALKENELGLGSSMNIYGYRLAMILTGGVGVGLVGSEFLNLTWGQLYIAMALCVFIGIVTTLLAPEPPAENTPKTLTAAVVEPFREFLKRDGAMAILAFVFLFKLGDALGGALLTPYYVEIGFSNADIGLIAKTVGLAFSLVGMLVGGLIILKMGVFHSLWFIGILQALSTAGFAILVWTGPQNWALALTVIFEDISAGMGNAAFVAFISMVCNKRYTATQYAVLSSIAMLGRTFFSGFTGGMVKSLGWAPFFMTCALIAVPGLLMLLVLRKYQSTDSPS